jgi:hypothetical protein
MTSGSWRYAAASALGTSHAKLGSPCQDAHACDVVLSATGGPILVAVVADGAGSASRSQDGSRLSCDFVAAAVRTFCDAGGAVRDLSRETVSGWLTRLQAEIAALADAEGLGPRDFACTLVAAIIGEEHAAFFQLGDGAMVVSDGDDYAWIFWPDQGEYENLTFFVTDPQSLERLQVDLCERRIEEIALFSDGLQRLVLNYQSRTAHAPFFRPLLSTVRAADGEAVASLSAKLAAYLNSPPVNDRTDDDKTLILATRRP